MSNGIFSKLGLEKNFALVKQLGFENIEFNMKSVRKENETAVYCAAKLLNASKLKCLTLHSASLHVKDEVEVHRAVYYGKISLEFARRLKTPVMTVHSNVSKPLLQPVRKKCLTEIFSELNRHAKSSGVRLALENLSYTSSGFGKNVDQLEEVLSVIDDGDMGITIDFCHALETKTATELLEHYGSRVCNVHMANKSHKPFTEPEPELTAFLNRLNDLGYAGPITLELAHGTSMEEILRSKALFDKLLRQF
ncbi:MAG TPA: sugar phosphate isomerase/epimerase family protein [Candidatus Limnocylindrales bacterium]|nr:sugar phosphate isomerase/epimerase family protein [Candidatus Limnocylindrales bacterium]